jgi:hypothetical protein
MVRGCVDLGVGSRKGNGHSKGALRMLDGSERAGCYGLGVDCFVHLKFLNSAREYRLLMCSVSFLPLPACYGVGRLSHISW